MLKKRGWGSLIFLFCFSLTGCSGQCYRAEAFPDYSRNNPSLEELRAFYDYTPDSFRDIVLIEENSVYRHYRFTFPFALRDSFPGKENVEMDYFVPNREGVFPAVVILPHLAGKSGLESFFASGLLDSGFAVLSIGEPYFTEDRRRSRWWMNELNNRGDLAKIKMLFRQLVVDTRRGIDFLSRRKEIDRENIGLMGISFGGCMAVLVSGVDERIKASSFVLAGGDLPVLIAESPYTRIMREAMDRGGISYRELDEEWENIEPLLLAGHIEGEDVLLITAVFDRLIPRSCSRKLRESLDRPPVKWIPSGHYGSILFMGYVRSAVVDFFQESLTREE